MIKVLKIVGISFGVILLFLIVGSYFFFPDMCGNTVIISRVSPDNEWKVVLFERNCGATTGFSSQISLIESDEELKNDAGNIYIAEGYPNGYTIKWESTTSVRISGASSNSNKKISQFKGVQFSYK